MSQAANPSSRKASGHTGLTRDELKYIKIAGPEQIEFIGRNALRRFSDEAISELEMTTKVIRKGNNCR